MILLSSELGNKFFATQPILSPYFRKRFEVAVRGGQHQIHLPGQCRQHDVNLRKHTPTLAQLLEDFAI